MDQVSLGRNRPRVGVYREKPGSDIIKQGVLKKAKKVQLQIMLLKKKYFVLRSTSSSGPARLDYFDSEEKFRSNKGPRKSISLHHCFNINKRKDAKHLFGITLFLDKDSFCMIADSQAEQESWLNNLLEYQNEYLLDGEAPRVHYDWVWQGTVKHKTPSAITSILGPYRLCLLESEKSVSLVKLSEVSPAYTFQFSSIRLCGHKDSFFFMEVGRSAVTGSGEISMLMEDNYTAQSMHEIVMDEMAASRSSQEHFRRRSNTNSSTHNQHRNTVLGDEPFHRKRAQSETKPKGSPRHNRSITMIGQPSQQQRPKSTVVIMPHPSMPENASASSSPLSLPESYLKCSRNRTGSVGSRTSDMSHHSDNIDGIYYQNTGVMTPENSFSSLRSMTPEPKSECIYDDEEEESDNEIESNDYIAMTPGQNSKTPSPTNSQAERPGQGSDYLPMTPTGHSGASSPTRFMDRPGSSCSDGYEMHSASEGYMDMQPGSQVNSPSSVACYLDMTPGYTGTSGDNGYMEMTPGMRVTADPGPGYVPMDGAWTRSPAAPIPCRSGKDASYLDMGVMCPSSQTLPTVKEGGSGEAYLPMSPSGQSPVSSAGLKPAKVFSYLSDDSMSGEFPKRAYSVGSRPTTKQIHRTHPPHEPLRKQPLDSNKSSSAPHLIVQKNRSMQIDHPSSRSQYLDAYSNMSPLSQSMKSDDADSFAEMDFYRPRTASDSYGCRPRSSSFGKQFMHVQGHRPRSSSHGQASKYERKMSKLAVGLKTDSFDSVKTTSQSDVTSKSKRSQESLGKFSTSSRNSSSESLKRESEVKKNSISGTDYMDMGFEKRKTPSPNIHGMSTPSADPIGYVDMTLGSSVPKSLSRGISPSSSSQSISLGSSPASINFPMQVEKSSKNEAKVIKASGKVIQKQVFMTPSPSNQGNNHLKVTSLTRVKKAGRSPVGSGKESEDESYVPFQPGGAGGGGSGLDESHRTYGASHEALHRGHAGIKVQHGYSKSLDASFKTSETEKMRARVDSKSGRGKKDEKLKQKSDDEQKLSKSGKSRKDSQKKSPKNKSKSKKNESPVCSPEEKQLAKTLANECGPSLEQIEQIPENDLFSDKYLVDSISESYTCTTSDKGAIGGSGQTKEDGYMDYCPGIDMPLSPTIKPQFNNQISSSTPKTSTAFFGTQAKEPEKGLCKEPENDYFEIDCSPVTMPVMSAAPRIAESKAMDESDYMEADPATLFPSDVAISTVPHEDDSNFSYMDFNPADPSTMTGAGSNTLDVKAPHRVKSYLSHSPESESLAVVNPDPKVKGQNPVSEKVKPKKETGKCEDKSGCESGCEGLKSKGGKMKKSELSIMECDTTTPSTRERKVSSGNVGGKPNKVDIKSDRKQVAGETESIVNENKAPAKFLIKHTLTVHAEPVQDEGYCDLDFSEPPPTRKHNRSGSSSSTSSERSRKFILENTTPMPEDDIPCPETPVSYICDDSDVSVTSDPLGKLDSNSSMKQSGNRSQATSKNSSVSSLSGGSTGQLNEDPRKPLQSPRSGQMNMQFYDAQNQSAVSRQCSVPGNASVFSPKPGNDRCRKASGPAGFPMSGNGKSGNGLSQSIGSQVSKRPALDPVVAPSQELMKQKSMPCMNVQNFNTARANPLPSECLIKENVQSRHSFSDLSQYEEMSFPGQNIEGGSREKSSSQQQLGETVCETKLNYAELDIGGSTENVDEKSPRVTKSRHPSSIDDLTQSTPPVSYAEIDYEKTAESLKGSNKDVKFQL